LLVVRFGSRIGSQTLYKCFKRTARAIELEYAAAVTGQRSNQLNYVPNRGINDLA